MNTEHWILLLLWVCFGLLHSIFAASGFKKLLQPVMDSWFKYYRFIYSFFAFITLAFLIFYESSIESNSIPFLLHFKYPVGLPLGLTGLLIMAICIKKYFYYLSGIDVFSKQTATTMLETTGLHRYVRHPLYFGTIIFVWSLLLFIPLFSHLIGCVMLTIYTIAGTFFEEKKLVTEFGEQYTAYKKRVPMLIPHFW